MGTIRNTSGSKLIQLASILMLLLQPASPFLPQPRMRSSKPPSSSSVSIGVLLTWQHNNVCRPRQEQGEIRSALSMPSQRKRTHRLLASTLNGDMSANTETGELTRSLPEIKAKKKGQKKGRKAAVKKKKKTTKPKKEKEVFHWIDSADETILKCANSPQLFRTKIRGEPRPLNRHRTARGHVYNPSAKYQASFCKAVEQQLLAVDDATTPGFGVWKKLSAKSRPTLFGEDQYLAVTIIFRKRRPNHDFVSSRREIGNRKDNAPVALKPIRSDVDNLSKFVFDSLEGLLFENDNQIVSLHAVKIIDDEGLCEGSTEMSFQVVTDDVMEDLLVGSFREY